LATPRSALDRRRHGTTDIGDITVRLFMAGYRRLADAIIQQKTTLTGRSRSS